ncbi:hypothetical protein EDC01DRAFT_776141 [Geopyxis carbonaria]|nr:hypothetical protein EDC01DRAFT_776141 [Geopyxis carbonaria]
MASSVSLEAENLTLKARILELETELARYRSSATAQPPAPAPPALTATPDSTTATPPSVSTNEAETAAFPQSALTLDEYKRYGRQMILEDIGLPGQLTLKHSRILIIGLGGLGCPAALYLNAAGIGTLGLLDHDTVESSNLHRQILHTPASIGSSKVHSAAARLRAQNPSTHLILHPIAFTAETAVATVRQYDLVLDCTDHPALRYLISDACVVAGKPLVSASALRLDGQLVVLNAPPGAGPCYRCVWPVPPPAASVTSCGEGGVLGAVVGAMGVMQALEAVKVLLGKHPRESRLMMLNAGGRETAWRVVRMRGRREGCRCAAGGLTEEEVKAGDYVAFCGGVAGVKEGGGERVTVEHARTETALVVDVRDETQFGICKLPGSINIPFSEWLQVEEGQVPDKMAALLREKAGRKVLMVCRLGNDSQVTTKRVMESPWGAEVQVRDVVGGVAEWARRYPGDGVVEY